MKQQLYAKLVNRQPGICSRYHRLHDGSNGIIKICSWIYLRWLNFCYYILFCRFLGKRPAVEIYETKRLLTAKSESESFREEYPGLSVEEYIKTLQKYEVISFDMFDTLVFRPFQNPTDLFYLVGEQLGFMDFKNVRIQAEHEARLEKKTCDGHMEVTLADIWERLAKKTGLCKEEGMRVEMETEIALCCANPFMLSVWESLRSMGKRLIIVSDMYLPKECFRRILDKTGFQGAEKIFVSCEYGKSKADGSLFPAVEEYCKNRRMLIHVGDNPQSDVRMAKKYGISVCPYPQVGSKALLYRAYDMSPMIGGAYRGIVSTHIYNGKNTYSMEYEYGYIYGGLFVTGYCTFIHDYCRKNEIDRILFLSRDGDILRRAYELLYPGEDTRYVYWSRKAAAKLMAEEDRHDFFRRFLFHKVNQNYTVWQALYAMELGELVRFVQYSPEEKLTDQNVLDVQAFIEENWEVVAAAYAGQREASGLYYGEMLSGCKKALAVDIGWAGSGAVALARLTERVWKLPCRIIGMVAGTNTIHNAEPDASEPFLQSGKLVPYLYAQSFNRDLLKKHDPNREYNVFWELLLSSTTPQFDGFYMSRPGDGGNGRKITVGQTREIWLRFGREDENKKGIEQIQKGILDFVENYKDAFFKYPYMFRISGRDAYAPMLLAAGRQEKYLRAIAGKFDGQVNVD